MRAKPGQCRQPGASVSAVAFTHRHNTNVVRKWLAGRSLKRMGDAVPATKGTTPALQFVPVGAWSGHSVSYCRASIRGHEPREWGRAAQSRRNTRCACF